MDKEEVIQDQAEQIAELREEKENLRERVVELEESLDEIGSRLICVGGPLNDGVNYDFSEKGEKLLRDIEEITREKLRERV